MELGDYLSEKKINRKDFCEEMGITVSYLCSIIGKKFKTSKKLAEKIEKATDGIIKKESLINDIFIEKCPTCGKGHRKKRKESN